MPICLLFSRVSEFQKSLEMVLFRRKSKQEAEPPRILVLRQFPAAIYAIGDLHGCLSLYDQMEETIVQDARDLDGTKLIVCLGDVVDRGPQTAQLLDRLTGPAPAGFQRVVLRGNHEDMMGRFLDEPRKNLNWLAWGGKETLHSYGISPEGSGGFENDGFLLKHKVQMAVPEAHREFLNGLPHALICEHLRFAHAGYDLDLAAEQQNSERLIWGPPERCDDYQGENLLVHGHVVVSDVDVAGARINVDLGAYETGRLACVRFLPFNTKKEIFSVGCAAPE